ncbi:unnamed protein product [Protopolystoma xenopodis]|uniref:Uncharacterized protein n=1 Tax=Protopolystoma xenopodis TaxID=117903 RepID=A0A448XFM9_9PLAT|nr:unnamed protein product [Protopolystoma xenopodis]
MYPDLERLEVPSRKLRVDHFVNSVCEQLSSSGIRTIPFADHGPSLTAQQPIPAGQVGCQRKASSRATEAEGHSVTRPAEEALVTVCLGFVTSPFLVDGFRVAALTTQPMMKSMEEQFPSSYIPKKPFSSTSQTASASVQQTKRDTDL